MIMERTKALGIMIVGILVASIVVVVLNLPPATPPENGENGDTTPPVVTITGPSADAVVYGAEAITFSATDENGIPRAEIYIDGVLTAVGQSYNWDTLGVADGPHTIMCRARDPSTNWSNQTISVMVNNSIDFSSPDFDPVFKIMTYNIQESGINPDWIEVVKEENADIIMFVETGLWDDDGSAEMIEAVEELNTYFSDEDPYEAFCTQGISFSTSGEAVFSRFPVQTIVQIQNVVLDDASGYDVTHDFLDAVININGTSVHFVGVHLKAAGGETNENRREWENEGIINYFDSLGEVPIVYLGDLNSVSPVDVGPLAPYWDPGVGPMTMLIDPDDPTYGQYASEVHNFTDVFRTLYPDRSVRIFNVFWRQNHTPQKGCFLSWVRSRDEWITPFLVPDISRPPVVGRLSLFGFYAKMPLKHAADSRSGMGVQPRTAFVVNNTVQAEEPFGSGHKFEHSDPSGHAKMRRYPFSLCQVVRFARTHKFPAPDLCTAGSDFNRCHISQVVSN